MANRRDMFAMMGGALLAMGATPAQARMGDAVLSTEQGKLTQEPFGDLRIYYSGSTEQLETLDAGSLQLKPGMEPHPPHKHVEEEIMVITEGNGEISLNGKISACGPGAMMYCAADHMHGIVNTGKTPLTFYFVKWKAKSG